MRRILAFTLLALAGLPHQGLARAWPGRVTISLNGAFQATSSTFEDDLTFLHPNSGNIPGEEAAVETRYEVPTGALFDGGAVVRLAGNFGLGVSVSMANGTNDVEIVARIPHPLLIGAHRQVEGAVPARHVERGIHVQAVYRVAATERLYFAFSGGPSHFNVEQKVVSAVTASESYPFDTATFASANLQVLRGTGWGVNTGVDAGWMFTRRFGVGGLLRYSKGTVSLAPTGREVREIDAGGLHAGIGARIAF